MNTKKVYSLKSTWTRQLHRFHTLGNSQLSYRNDSVGISESRIYPRHISDINESNSQSLLGDTLWQVSNWAEGWAIVDESKRLASLNFSSRNGDLFHSIQLQNSSQWDCFECLLKLFAKPANPSNFFSNTSSPPQRKVMNSNCTQLAEVLNNATKLGQNLRCTLPTTGEIITRDYPISKVITKPKALGILSSDNSEAKVLINTSLVDHINLKRTNHTLQATIYGSAGIPKLIIEAA